MRQSKKTAANLLACIVLAAATLRAFAFWAADPMLAYANNFDQIRTLKVFGLHPKDSPKGLYEMTPEGPYRYFVRADTLHAPIYPSSDLLFKAVQVATMAAFRDSDGRMDIKIAALPVLLAWLACIWLIFRKLLAKPLAALGFAGWILLVADPINLLFLNTWYAEFSAFALSTVFVGIAWLWLFQLIALRKALLWGGICIAVLSLNRNQYMFMLPAVAALVGAALASSQSLRVPSPAAAAKWALFAAACLLPPLVYTVTAKKSSEFFVWAATNRTNTVFGALLPASKDPANMLKHMGLSPEGCAGFMGTNLYTQPLEKFEAGCPKSLKLGLGRIAKGVAGEPTVLVTIIHNIALHQDGFLQHHIGHIEGERQAYIDDASESKFDGIRFRTSPARAGSGSHQPLYRQSVDPLIRSLSTSATVLLIWFAALGPALAALAAWALKQGRWAFIFLLSGLLFNYALFSSILGDGYFELERHAILCFSFGALFFVLLGSWAVCTLSARPAPGKGTPDSHTA